MLGFIHRFCPWHITLIIANSIMSNFIPVMNLLYLKFVIDSIVKKETINYIFFIILIMFFINMISILTNLFIQNKIVPKNSKILNKEMQVLIFDKISELDYMFFEDSNFYSKLASAAQQSDVRALSILDTFAILIGNIFSIGSLFTLIGSLDFLILIIVMVNAMFNIVLNMKSINLQHDYYKNKINLERKIGYFNRLFVTIQR